MVYTILFQFDLIRFQKDFSACRHEVRVTGTKYHLCNGKYREGDRYPVGSICIHDMEIIRFY